MYFCTLQLTITESSVGMAIENLTTIVMATGETSDQNSDNLAVVDTIFSETATLLSGPRTSLAISYVKQVRATKRPFDFPLSYTQPLIIFQIVGNTVTILDGIEEWPQDILQDDSNKLVTLLIIIFVCKITLFYISESFMHLSLLPKL